MLSLEIRSSSLDLSMRPAPIVVSRSGSLRSDVQTNRMMSAGSGNEAPGDPPGPTMPEVRPMRSAVHFLPSLSVKVLIETFKGS